MNQSATLRKPRFVKDEAWLFFIGSYCPPPAVGERVWVRFDGLEAMEGTVRWVEGHTGGVQFERPLHEAVFQRVAAASKKEM